VEKQRKQQITDDEIENVKPLSDAVAAVVEEAVRRGTGAKC